ncbi:MAG: SDR family oxidoreductase [Mobiluncus porci]|uniref:SDR family NAD(P)-dependent oxidoreductase n=1 Tax=Mobiluncus porci TaxID=2652278 RepID=UPI0023F0642B|nr:SDR family oxidoreductase [Mobiluncus porci]MDD7542028.1 SDR family oxidoreductase [Mobiluncus porci]MDY5747650.1 SDR family oxidoreductase [Mobiluncus porci]
MKKASNEAIAVKVDVSDSESVQNMVNETVKTYGRLDCAFNNPAYVSAKHGVVGLTKAAALENGQFEIRINTVAPGTIDTPMLHEALEKMGVKPEDYAPQLSLLNRFGQPREIAHAALWLLSDAASYITSTPVYADAGYIGR